MRERKRREKREERGRKGRDERKKTKQEEEIRKKGWREKRIPRYLFILVPANCVILTGTIWYPFVFTQRTWKLPCRSLLDTFSMTFSDLHRIKYKYTNELRSLTRICFIDLIIYSKLVAACNRNFIFLSIEYLQGKITLYAWWNYLMNFQRINSFRAIIRNKRNDARSAKSM